VAAEFHPSARRELIAAAERYEDAAEGLGDEFLHAIEHAVELLATNPEAGEVIVPRPRRPIRKWVLSRFPFALIYVAAEPLRILAVAHGKRQPRYWSSRR
jgi:toxin ParE1/3/4